MHFCKLIVTALMIISSKECSTAGAVMVCCSASVHTVWTQTAWPAHTETQKRKVLLSELLECLISFEIQHVNKTINSQFIFHSMILISYSTVSVLTSYMWMIILTSSKSWTFLQMYAFAGKVEINNMLLEKSSTVCRSFYISKTSTKI